MDPYFFERLEIARLYADVPFRLSSAFRCIPHNRDVGGVEDSAHTKGLAVDIRIPDAYTRFKVLYGLIKAGFKRIGVYETYIHVDDDQTKSSEVVWMRKSR